VDEFFAEAQLEWFYHHIDIAKAVFKLAIEGEHIDLVSVKTELETS
jgi:hypothetical protein